MKFLFVCSRNRMRSPTAEMIFSERAGIEALSAGTSDDAETPVSAELIEWADLILVMENVHRQRLRRMFGSSLLDKKLVVLGIPDEYSYMEPELIGVLTEKVARYLPQY
jgi:predicted protein tyrosine phosphatase